MTGCRWAAISGRHLADAPLLRYSLGLQSVEIALKTILFEERFKR